MPVIQKMDDLSSCTDVNILVNQLKSKPEIIGQQSLFSRVDKFHSICHLTYEHPGAIEALWKEINTLTQEKESIEIVRQIGKALEYVAE
ncbi:hypothetical protein [Aliikangiella coralliicola]|uniref:Uncharacterized protein n=1 Tax=Aliikangiella coralliicola TaxID=2592383 RepID=A0A545UC45_9GAMM|nr:hypothetical protein [Aliikangiella coralliicola]TQV87034.1 hypothetical protein FLL46_14610 [Aliikangiella coralliicola]